LKNYKNAIYGFANDTLQATPKIEFKLKDEQIQNDSSSFYIYYQDILLFEKNLLELALINLSGSCTWYSSYLPVNKTKDTVAVNEEYSIAVTPDLYFPRRVDVQPDSITVFKKGEKMIIPFRTEIVGGILLLRFSPNEAGKYVIKGAVKIKSLYNDFYRSHRFTDSVFVRVI
jgi:hypothetical protein